MENPRDASPGAVRRRLHSEIRLTQPDLSASQVGAMEGWTSTDPIEIDRLCAHLEDTYGYVYINVYIYMIIYVHIYIYI